MAKRSKTSAAAPRLEALHAVGDLRALRAEARALLDGPGASEADRAAAAAALRRTGPERAAALAAALGFCLFTAVALAGILAYR